MVFYPSASLEGGSLYEDLEITHKRIKKLQEDGTLGYHIGIYPPFFEATNALDLRDKEDDLLERDFYSDNNRYFEFIDKPDDLNEHDVIETDADAKSIIFGHEYSHIITFNSIFKSSFDEPNPYNNLLKKYISNKEEDEKERKKKESDPEGFISLGFQIEIDPYCGINNYVSSYGELISHKFELQYIEENSLQVSDYFFSKMADKYYANYICLLKGYPISRLCVDEGINNCRDEDINIIRKEYFNCILKKFRYRPHSGSSYYDILRLKNGKYWILYDWYLNDYISLPLEISADACDEDEISTEAFVETLV